MQKKKRSERDKSSSHLLSSMLRRRMRLVAESEGVGIYCPSDGKFSFFNSPYPAHYSYTGIDIYPKRNIGEPAPSPVSGKVMRIRRVKCPQGKYFTGSNHDYAILLRSLETPERWIKILHVKPTVRVGDVVRLGEDLGTLLRSGYFDFWTDPHVHIEVRKSSDPLRARGGFKLKRSIELDGAEAVRELTGTVVESRPDYLMVALDEKLDHGLPVDLAGQVGLLDAGIPHYRWAGVHVRDDPPSNCFVELCGRKIGVIKSTHSNMCLAKCYNPVFVLKGKRVGLSLHIYPSREPLVKIVPQRPSKLMLSESEGISVLII